MNPLNVDRRYFQVYLNQFPQSAAHHLIILRELLASEGLSRAELQRRTGLRPNSVIDVVEEMKQAGWVFEAGRVSVEERLRGESRGRPAVRLKADGSRCDVVGLTLQPKRIEAVRMNLFGEQLGPITHRRIDRDSRIGRIAANVLAKLFSPSTLAVGVCASGLIDEGDMRLLLSSSAPTSPGLSLAPILTATGDRPVALENTNNALGDQWRLAHREWSDEPTLLVVLEDGRIGASWLLPRGGASEGCVRGCNELGHFQVPADGRAVDKCYCGGKRCLEQIFSSKMVGSLVGSSDSLVGAIEQLKLDPGSELGQVGGWVMDRLVEAVANAINFVRPCRVVWACPNSVKMSRALETSDLNRRVKAAVLPGLRERVVYSHWDAVGTGDTVGRANSAGYLALAMLTGWRRPTSGSVLLKPLLSTTSTPPATKRA